MLNVSGKKNTIINRSGKVERAAPDRLPKLAVVLFILINPKEEEFLGLKGKNQKKKKKQKSALYATPFSTPTTRISKCLDPPSSNPVTKIFTAEQISPLTPP